MIRNFFATEGAKLREMNFTGKCQHIWEYYKVQIGIVLIAIILTGGLIHAWFNDTQKQDYLYLAWQVGAVPSNFLGEMGHRLTTIVEDQDRYIVAIRPYHFTDDPYMNMGLITRFHSMLASGNIHVVIAPKAYIVEYSEQSIVTPITDVLAEVEKLCSHLHKMLSDRVLNLTFRSHYYDVVITDAMAINLVGIPMLTDMGFIGQDIYLATVVNTDRFYETAKALYVMFYEGAG